MSIGIIFLDIDGVLNNMLDAEKYPNESKAGKRALYWYSERCVGLLNKLTDDTGARIVVTSTWRMGLDDAGMEAVLREIGVTGVYQGKTDVLSERYTFRGNEIIKWMKDNEELIGQYYDFRKYVIFDDDSDMLLWHRDNYISCDPFCGLTPRSIYRATGILKNAPCEDTGQEYSE